MLGGGGRGDGRFLSLGDQRLLLKVLGNNKIVSIKLSFIWQSVSPDPVLTMMGHGVVGRRRCNVSCWVSVHQLLTQAQTTSARYIDERKNLCAPRPPVVQLSTGWKIPFGISIKKCKPLNCSRLLTLDGSKVAAKQDSPVPPFQRI